MKKTILSLILVTSLVVSSPLAALAQETPPDELNQQQTTTETSSVPADPSPTPDTSASLSSDPSPVPSPSPSPLTPQQEAELEAQQAKEALENEIMEDEAKYLEELREELAQQGITWTPPVLPGQENNQSNTGTSDNGNIGNASITTGDASAGGTIVTNVNQSSIQTDPACSICPGGAVTVQNSENGTGSNSSAGSCRCCGCRKCPAR